MSIDAPQNSPHLAAARRGRLRPCIRTLVGCLTLLLLLFGSGCESPLDFFEANPPSVDGQQESGQQESGQQESEPQAGEQAGEQAKESNGESGGEEARKQAPLDVEVHSLEPGAEQAQMLLEENFEGFLDRRALGFSLDLPEVVLEDLRALGQRVSTFPQRVGELSAPQLLHQLFPTLAALFLIIIFALLDRAFLRWAKHGQAKIHIDISRIATRVWRSLVLVAGRVSPLMVLVGLSYFPIQALANQAPWSIFLTEALWLGVAYRAIQGALVVCFSGGLLAVPKPHAGRLESFGRWVTRVIFGFLVALAALDAFEYRREVYNFVAVCLQLTVAFFPLYLFFARKSVMAMLPAYEGSRLYSFFRRLLGRYYRGLLAVSVLLLLMRAAGYVNAATFILVRGYAIILLLIVAFVAGNKLQRFLRRRTEAIDTEQVPGDREEATGPRQLARSLEQFLFVGGGILVVVLVLDLLAVREAVVALLKTPLLAAGNVQISLYNVLAVGLIIFGTILVIKILKAMLNAKIYPAFSVDVGVAYALNTLLSYVLVVVGFLMVLAAIGVNLSAIAVVLASLGVGIGFGLQTLTENLISGFIILFGRSVKKGDYITVRDTYGRVDAVGARSVIIRTPDNYDMLIPSKEIVGGQIINWTYRDTRVRMRVDVGVSYNADPSRVREVLLGAADAAKFVLDTPEPEVWLVGFGDSSVDFQLLVYYDCREVSPFRFKGLIYFDIWDALKAADIEIPFPQRDLHVRSADVLPEVDRMKRGWDQSERPEPRRELPPAEAVDEE